MLLKGLPAAGASTQAVCSRGHESGILPFLFSLIRGGYDFQKSMGAASSMIFLVEARVHVFLVCLLNIMLLGGI